MIISDESTIVSDDAVCSVCGSQCSYNSYSEPETTPMMFEHIRISHGCDKWLNLK